MSATTIPPPVGHLSPTQEGMWQHLFELPRDQQPDALLKWALARLTFYGPLHEPCANAIRVYLGEDQVAPPRS